MQQINENEAAREAQRDYYREWRKKNPEKVRAINQRYWARRAEKIRQEKEVNNEQ